MRPRGLAAKLRKGGSPEITKGEHAGDFIALDHILPRTVVPELTARFFNPEALPARDNLGLPELDGKCANSFSIEIGER